MKLHFDGMFVSKEKLISKKNSEYYKIVVQENLGALQENIFIFGSKLFAIIEGLSQGDTIVVIFNRFYSYQQKKDVFIVCDVVPC